MFKQILIVAILVCFIGLIGVANLIEANENIYDEINEHLETELRHDERVKENLDEAIEWLVTKVASKGCIVLSYSFMSYKRALKQLKALRDGIQCDQSGFELLRSIAKDTNYRTHWRPSYMKSTRRIDKVLNQLFLQHARGCHQTYVDRFRFKINQLSDKTKAQNVLDLAMGKVLAHAKYIVQQTDTLEWSECDLDTLKDHFKSYPASIRVFNDRFDDGPSIREALKYLARGHPDVKYAHYLIDPSVDELFAQRDEIENLYDIYIESSCKYYIDKLGYDLLTPAMYDSEMLRDDEFKNENQVRVIANLDYYIGRTGFGFCYHLLRERIPLIKKLIRSLNVPIIDR